MKLPPRPCAVLLGIEDQLQSVSYIFETPSSHVLFKPTEMHAGTRRHASWHLAASTSVDGPSVTSVPWLLLILFLHKNIGETVV